VQTSVGALSSHLISRTPVRAIKDAATTTTTAAAALVLDFWGLSVRVSSRGLRSGVPPTPLQYMIGVTFPCVDLTQCARRHFVSDNALEVAAFRG